MDVLSDIYDIISYMYMYTCVWNYLVSDLSDMDDAIEVWLNSGGTPKWMASSKL